MQSLKGRNCNPNSCCCPKNVCGFVDGKIDRNKTVFILCYVSNPVPLVNVPFRWLILTMLYALNVNPDPIRLLCINIVTWLTSNLAIYLGGTWLASELQACSSKPSPWGTEFINDHPWWPIRCVNLSPVAFATAHRKPMSLQASASAKSRSVHPAQTPHRRRHFHPWRGKLWLVGISSYQPHQPWVLTMGRMGYLINNITRVDPPVGQPGQKHPLMGWFVKVYI